MTRQELEQQYLVVDNMTFTPRYDYTRNEIIQDGETIFIDDYTITATAQEVYAEWQAQQNATPVTEMTNAEITEYLADLDYRVTMKELGL